jgi:hypothetical protein
LIFGVRAAMTLILLGFGGKCGGDRTEREV